MKLVYTKHAQKKFHDLAALGVRVTKRQVIQTINHPYHLDTQTDTPNHIVSGELDQNHVLRVVYKTEGGIMTVITFYPARKRRYHA